MGIGKNGAVLRQIRTLFNVGATRELTDGQLLEQFATDRGEVSERAFAVLVERHGPMVLRVCRSVLNDPNDRDDAFQATFLVLVRKARALWVRDSLGPWLHQVAFRTASCSRSKAARRRRHERGAALLRNESHSEGRDDGERVLHEEIDRLPERYRAPVVLCDLEGCTHVQAARHLGLPVGTVKSRLSRGRERLRRRIIRRGWAPHASLLANALGTDGTVTSIAPGLLDSTSGAAARFLTARTVVRGSTTTLAEGVLRSMSMTRWLKVASGLIIAGATASGIDLLAQKSASDVLVQPAGNPKDARADDVPVYEVKPGKLTVTVFARGALEPTRTEDAYCSVEGRTPISKILLEGTHVKKGQLVCQLDAGGLNNQLIHQAITEKRAESDFETSKLAREAAEIALHEYEQGSFPLELNTLRGEIAAAQSATQEAEGRLERTRHAGQRLKDVLAARQGDQTPADIVAELDIEDRLEDTRQTLKRQRQSIELARAKREVLEKYTRDRVTRELRVDLERKRSDELIKKRAWELAKNQEANLNRQMASCMIYAHSDGQLVYATDPGRYAGHQQIEEGATVRERQKIFSLWDPSGPMQVNTKVGEAKIHLIDRGLQARITVDAFPDATFKGVVTEVSPLPDASTFFSSGPKVYTTKVEIEKGVPSLIPRLTAGVEILVKELDNVLSVPVQAVLHYDDRDHVAVKKPAGDFEWRDVVLGISNEEHVEVKEGIRSGEIVVPNPISLMSEEEKRTKFGGPPPRPTPPAAATVPAKAVVREKFPG